MEHDSPPRRRIVVDGSNIATEGGSTPSLAQLDEAIRTFLEEHRGFSTSDVTVVVDATFGHRIDPSEQAAFEEALEHGEMITPPAGAVGRGDGFILRIAEKSGALVLSNDSFQEFHAERPWLFEPGRLIGGKPVPGVGWVFTPRTPVRGPRSRSVTAKSKRDAKDAEDSARASEAASTEEGAAGSAAKRGTKAAKASKAAKSTRTTKATKGTKEPTKSAKGTKELGEATPAKATKAAKAAASTKATKAAKAAKATKGAKELGEATPAKATKAAKAAASTKAIKAAKAAKSTKGTKELGEATPPKAAKAATSGAPTKAAKGTGGARGAKQPKAQRGATEVRAPRGAEGGGPRPSGAVEALNDPMAFLTFVANHSVGSAFDGVVVAFTSHGAHVDVGGMLCHVPLRGLADPPPQKARLILNKGETRSFVLVSLDAARRRAELALPGVRA